MALSRVSGVLFTVDMRAVYRNRRDVSSILLPTQALERVWLDGRRESDLARVLESPFFPGRLIAMGDALMQVCMHSHGHRSQCATKLRAMGGEPPSLDFILWLKDRPVPVWE